MIKRIIDKRIKEKFMMDDAYLNGQARICGWQATLVYNSLCRHTNSSQESFPSIQLMSQELGVSRDTVMRGIDNLEKFNVIQVRKSRTKGGQWLNNTYILIDKSQWEKSQVVNTDMVSHVGNSSTPSRPQQVDQVADIDTKETHEQGNKYKETHKTETSSAEVVILLDIFSEINPAIKMMYANITQRKACRFLIDTYSLERVKSVIKNTLPKTNGLQFFPTITTPLQLQDKWVSLESAIRKYQSEKLSTKEKYPKI